MRDPTSHGYRLLDVVKGANLAQPRIVLRAAAIGSLLLVVTLLSFFFSYDDTPAPRQLPKNMHGLAAEGAANILGRTQIGLCSNNYDLNSVARLLASEAKYEHLIEDQFTVVIQTYKRPKILQKCINRVIAEESKLLHSIIVAWNDIDTPVPKDWSSPGGIRVHYRQSEKNSLNSKLIADSEIKTKAVLLQDDDTYYASTDMEYAFEVWRTTGQNRLVGAYPRMAIHEDNAWKYTIPRKTWEYNIMLTGLTFTHIAFMDYYSSDDRIMTQVRQYVDDNLNCEDIAMNFLTQSLTGCAPIFVKGQHGAKHVIKPPSMPRIGQTKGHLDRRHACVNKYVELWGRMPLVSQEGYMIRDAVGAPS